MVNPEGFIALVAVCAGLWYLIFSRKTRRSLNEAHCRSWRIPRNYSSFYESLTLATLLLFNALLTALSLYFLKLLIAEYWARYFG